MAEDEKRKKASMIVFSGDMDKLFAAFVVATGAAAIGMDVMMFFTFWGYRALRKDVRTGRGVLGRLMGLIERGDIRKANPSKYGFLSLGRWMFKKMMRDKNIASLVELRQLAQDLGVRMYACEMTMELLDISRDDLIDGITDYVGAGFFVEEAGNSDFTLFI